jgi:hypothetical protein
VVSGTPSGTSIRPSAGSSARCTYPPFGPVRVSTRRPTHVRSTPSPTSATVPATPTPGRYGGRTGKYSPPSPHRILVSTHSVSAAATSTTTSPGPGTGSGASPTTSTSGPPNRATSTTRTTTSSSARPPSRRASTINLG